MLECDTGSSPVDPFRERERAEALKRECANQAQTAGQNAKSLGGFAGCEYRGGAIGGGDYPGSASECVVTADDLLRNLESSLNSTWLDIQALRQALPRRLSPAADRALCELIRAARVRP